LLRSSESKVCLGDSGVSGVWADDAISELYYWRDEMIKKLCALIAAMCFCVSCAAGSGQFSADLNQLKEFTVADLQAALVDATAHKDVAASQCYATLLDVIATGLPQLPQKPVGAVSAFQALRDVIGQGPDQANAVAKKINIGCAALFVDANATIARLMAIGAGSVIK
jgi:hypothetical protein